MCREIGHGQARGTATPAQVRSNQRRTDTIVNCCVSNQIPPQSFVAGPRPETTRGRFECQVHECAVAAFGSDHERDPVLRNYDVRAGPRLGGTDQPWSGCVERGVHEIADGAQRLQVRQPARLDRQEIGWQRSERALPRRAANLNEQAACADPDLNGFELLRPDLCSRSVVDDQAVEATEQLRPLRNHRRIERGGPCATDRRW